MVFLGIARILGVEPPLLGHVAVIPALAPAGLMPSSVVKRPENFEGVMIIVIFVIFLSSALDPLRRMAESSDLLRAVRAANPFAHAVEPIRFALRLPCRMVRAARGARKHGALSRAGGLGPRSGARARAAQGPKSEARRVAACPATR